MGWRRHHQGRLARPKTLAPDRLMHRPFPADWMVRMACTAEASLADIREVIRFRDRDGGDDQDDRHNDQKLDERKTHFAFSS